MIRVRFAPSPTGYLHVGNVRAALINWLFAKKHGGHFLLRIDDTDKARSRPEYLEAIRRDLNWIGIAPDQEIRQSERLARYDAAAESLKEKGIIYPCYETAEELQRKRQRARALGLPPVYDRAACSLSSAERRAYESEGRAAHWRFRLSGEVREWSDQVRGPQKVMTSSLSDPVLIRADGSYLYMLPSVVDDIATAITHVLRGEDHISNSGVQMEIFIALGASPPQLGHLPLLIGADGQPLSKRLDSLALFAFRDRGIEPEMLAAFLAGIGSSSLIAPESLGPESLGPESLSPESLGPESLGPQKQGAAIPDLSGYGRSAAVLDEAQLVALNSAFIRRSDVERARSRLAGHPLAARLDEQVWAAIKANLDSFADAGYWLQLLNGDLPPCAAEEEDHAFLRDAADRLPAAPLAAPLAAASWSEWIAAIKTADSTRRGRALFRPLRLALTGRDTGPEMAALLPVMGRDLAVARLLGAIKSA